MKKTNWTIKKNIWLVVALVLLVMMLIEFLRPIYNWPNLVESTMYRTSPMDNSIYKIFGEFGAQFAILAVWSNLFFIGTLTIYSISGIQINYYFKNAVLTYLMTTLVLFITMICYSLSWGHSPYMDYMRIHLHVLVPIIGIIWFFTTREKVAINLKISNMITLIFPTIYLLFNLITFISSGNQVALYNFFNFTNVFFVNISVVWSIILTIVIMILIVGLMLFFNWMFAETNFIEHVKNYYPTRRRNKFNNK